MKIIFCCSPFNYRVVDPDYEQEYISAIKNGFEVELVNFEELEKNNIDKSIKTILPSDNSETALFRGWMLKPETYQLFYSSLESKNISLINKPDEYLNCHYFPYSYEIIKDKTPKSIYFDFDKNLDYTQIMKLLSVFNGKPILIKDYVKSQKHKWKDACFIHSSNDENEIKRVTDNFINLQGSDLNKGLVYREFLELEFIGEHSKSKMPLTKEYRLFFLNGKLVEKYNYWDEGTYTLEDNFIDEFLEIAKFIKSNFFTMDIAKTISGDWKIIELGDGQVSGLPDNA
ncbi:MAG: ATP-grasp domain-containing protein, partial [Candidatus Sericytochromatia bacterium]